MIFFGGDGKLGRLFGFVLLSAIATNLSLSLAADATAKGWTIMVYMEADNGP